MKCAVNRYASAEQNQPTAHAHLIQYTLAQVTMRHSHVIKLISCWIELFVDLAKVTLLCFIITDRYRYGSIDDRMIPAVER